MKEKVLSVAVQNDETKQAFEDVVLEVITFVDDIVTKSPNLDPNNNIGEDEDPYAN